MAGNRGGEREWAWGLPSPALDLIAERVSAPDLACLRSVCSAWWSKLRHLKPPSPEIPWVMVPTRDGGIKSDKRTFLSLPECRHHRFSSPLLIGKKIISSDHGWLVLLDDQIEMSLFQPITKEHIPLPSITTIPNFEFKAIRSKSTGRIKKFSDDLTHPNPLNSFKPEIFGYKFLKKVVLSCSPAGGADCVIALRHLHDGSDAISYARPGDTSWTLISDLSCVDILFISSSKLLAVTYFAELKEFDFSSTKPRTTTLVKRYRTRFIWNTYLAVCGGDILAVFRDQTVIPDPGKNGVGEMLATSSVQVKKLRSKGEGGGSQWVGTADIKGHCLFLGTNNSLTCSEPKVYGLKENSIYFMEGYGEHSVSKGWDRYGERSVSKEWKKSTRDVVVFDLQKNSCEFCFPHGHYLTYPPPIWFLPSFH